MRLIRYGKARPDLDALTAQCKAVSKKVVGLTMIGDELFVETSEELNPVELAALEKILGFKLECRETTPGR